MLVSEIWQSQIYISLTDLCLKLSILEREGSSISGRMPEKRFESLGAIVVEVDFAVVNTFDAADSPSAAETSTPPHRNEVDMSQLMAYAWDDFLAANGDSKIATSLAQIDP